MRVEFETTIKGGLPVIAVVRVCRAEPDVGITSPYGEIDDIYWMNGRPITQKVFDGIPKDDLDRLIEEALEE